MNTFKRSYSAPRSITALLIGLVFLSFLPFIGILALQHTFSDIGHDGQEHSAFDLCQWVQHHAGSTLDAAHPSTHGIPFSCSPITIPQASTLNTPHISPLDAPRPPPLFSSIGLS